jgi:Zn finger protein HypA/HybF involved in hydrogenase expression
MNSGGSSLVAVISARTRRLAKYVFRSMKNEIRCAHCDRSFSLRAPGTKQRNHCPYCLWSKHLDDRLPGDRRARCHGPMEPIAVSLRPDGEWLILHRCKDCHTIHANRIAGDDNAVRLLAIAAAPLASPPFPLAESPPPL